MLPRQVSPDLNGDGTTRIPFDRYMEDMVFDLNVTAIYRVSSVSLIRVMPSASLGIFMRLGWLLFNGIFNYKSRFGAAIIVHMGIPKPVLSYMEYCSDWLGHPHPVFPVLGEAVPNT